MSYRHNRLCYLSLAKAVVDILLKMVPGRYEIDYVGYAVWDWAHTHSRLFALPPRVRGLLIATRV